MTLTALRGAFFSQPVSQVLRPRFGAQEKPNTAGLETDQFVPSALRQQTPVRTSSLPVEVESLFQDNPQQLEQLKGIRRACISAGKVLRRQARQALDIETKSSDKDLVTIADKKSDALIQRILKRHFPGVEIMTEETFKESQLKSVPNKVLIVDPLDGTTNYAYGSGRYAVSIAYVEKGKPVLAGIYDVPSQKFYWAAKSKGAWMGNQRLKVSPADTLSKALVATDFTSSSRQDKRDENYTYFQRMNENARSVRRAGAGALDIAEVAAGVFGATWQLWTRPWDMAAGILLVEEAGGKVTDRNGEPVDLAKSYIEIVATNGKLHEAVLENVNPATLKGQDAQGLPLVQGSLF